MFGPGRFPEREASVPIPSNGPYWTLGRSLQDGKVPSFVDESSSSWYTLRYAPSLSPLPTTPGANSPWKEVRSSQSIEENLFTAFSTLVGPHINSMLTVLAPIS
jgi:hypothetical protein